MAFSSTGEAGQRDNGRYQICLTHLPLNSVTPVLVPAILSCSHVRQCRRSRARRGKTDVPTSLFRTVNHAQRMNELLLSIVNSLTLPSAPPDSLLSCDVTHNVCMSCVLPDLNSPKNSVIDPVSMPPPRRASSCFAPVCTCHKNHRYFASWVSSRNSDGWNTTRKNPEANTAGRYEKSKV